MQSFLAGNGDANGTDSTGRTGQFRCCLPSPCGQCSIHGSHARSSVLDACQDNVCVASRLDTQLFPRVTNFAQTYGHERLNCTVFACSC